MWSKFYQVLTLTHPSLLEGEGQGGGARLRHLFLLCFVSVWTTFSCGSETDTSSKPIELRFAAPPRLAAVQGMTAKVEISDVGTFDLTVAADGSASGEIRDVPVGKRTMAIRWYKNELVLVEVNRSLDLAAGLRVEVKVTPAEFVYPDADGNGISNIDEALGATTPVTTTGAGTTGTGTTTSTTSTTTATSSGIELKFTKVPDKTTRMPKEFLGINSTTFEWTLEPETMKTHFSYQCAVDSAVKDGKIVGESMGCTSPFAQVFLTEGPHAVAVKASGRPPGEAKFVVVGPISYTFTIVSD